MSYCVLVALLVSMATSCYAVGVGDQCEASTDCITTNLALNCHRMFTSASCTKGECACNTGINCRASMSFNKLYGQSCTRYWECGNGLTCISSVCSCAISINTYRSAIAKCFDPASKVYGESCTQSTECYNVRGDNRGIACSTTCQCATGYVHRSGSCYIPYLGEACTASPGCTTMYLPLPTDKSRQAETCTSGTCSCPSNATQYTTSYDGTSYSYCLATTTATLKQDGTTCTLHNECASKICGVCPADYTRSKRCLRVYVNECLNNPCMNGATCVNSEGNYTCECNAMWTGRHCDQADVNECLNNPCMNGATCVSSEGNYICECNAMWTGRHCDQADVNECLNNPCMNGATCVNSEGNYTCECNATWTGRQCDQADVNECLNNPCMNGATCVNSEGNYTCECNAMWTGRHCDQAETSGVSGIQATTGVLLTLVALKVTLI